MDASIDNLSVSNILLGKNHFCIWFGGAGKYCSSILKFLSILSNKSQELIRPSILSNSQVLIVGCGSVRSYIAIMLARNRVKFMHIIGFNQVTLSLLNQHACATFKDVSFSKVLIIKKYIKEIIGENCEIEEINAIYQFSTKEELILKETSEYK